SGGAGGGYGVALGGELPDGDAVAEGVGLGGGHHAAGVGDDPGGAQRVDGGAEEAVPQLGEDVAQVVAGEVVVALPVVEDGLLDEELVPGGLVGYLLEEEVLLGGGEAFGRGELAGHGRLLHVVRCAGWFLRRLARGLLWRVVGRLRG